MPLASIAAKAAAITPGAAAGAATITAIPTIGPWDTASRLPNGKRHGWLIMGRVARRGHRSPVFYVAGLPRQSAML